MKTHSTALSLSVGDQQDPPNREEATHSRLHRHVNQEDINILACRCTRSAQITRPSIKEQTKGKKEGAKLTIDMVYSLTGSTRHFLGVSAPLSLQFGYSPSWPHFSYCGSNRRDCSMIFGHWMAFFSFPPRNNPKDFSRYHLSVNPTIKTQYYPNYPSYRMPHKRGGLY